MNIKEFLDKKVALYNTPAFIKNDPISVPHSFSLLQDKEIAAFFAAIFAWGNRAIIIKKTTELLQLMDNAPFDFILHHQENDLKNLLNFKHRTFNTTDFLYFIAFLRQHYEQNLSLETAFIPPKKQTNFCVKDSLIHFHQYFFSLNNFPVRTKKHIATPANNSSCKRLNMFLRWMIREDKNGVDFGLWKNLKPAQLLIPIDLHVRKVATKLNLLTRKQTDFKACLQLTEALRQFDEQDPIKYDFALFGLGVFEKYY